MINFFPFSKNAWQKFFAHKHKQLLGKLNDFFRKIYINAAAPESSNPYLLQTYDVFDSDRPKYGETDPSRQK